MIRVKAIKYKKGWVISVGVDPTNPYDLPVKIFRDGKVLDPLLYTIAKNEITGATNKIYVPDEKYEETIQEIKKFYEKHGEYHGTNITITVLVSKEGTQNNGDVTIKELKHTEKPRIRKLSMAEILGQKPAPAAARPAPTEAKKSLVFATVEDADEIPIV